MFKLRFSLKAKRHIKMIPKTYKQALINTLDEIREEPFLGKSLSRDLLGFFSFKIGVYRIIYKVSKKDKIITILKIGHRSIVYVNDEVNLSYQ